jgi:hypothetical protein
MLRLRAAPRLMGKTRKSGKVLPIIPLTTGPVDHTMGPNALPDAEIALGSVNRESGR